MSNLGILADSNVLHHPRFIDRAIALAQARLAEATQRYIATLARAVLAGGDAPQ